MTLISNIKNIFQTPSTVHGPSSGLYHYVKEDEHEKSRIHLRLDEDGTGTLIVNASSVMHLNPTAAFMAWMILEGKQEQEIISSLKKTYRVSTAQAMEDLSAFRIQLSELLRPDGACPVHDLDLETIMPFSARPFSRTVPSVGA